MIAALDTCETTRTSRRRGPRRRLSPRGGAVAPAWRARQAHVYILRVEVQVGTGLRARRAAQLWPYIFGLSFGFAATLQYTLRRYGKTIKNSPIVRAIPRVRCGGTPRSPRRDCTDRKT